MSTHFSASFWLAKPTQPETIFERVVPMLLREGLQFRDDYVYFADMADGSEREAESIEGKSLSEAIEILTSWPALGTIEFQFPNHCPMGFGLNSFSGSQVDYVEFFIENTNRELQEKFMGLAKSVFDEIDEFGFAIGDLELDEDFDSSDFDDYESALKRARQLETEISERDLHQSMLLAIR